MKKKTIFILVESVKRELDAKTLFALKAINKNYRVVIGHKGNVWNIFNRCNPGIVLLKSFGPNNTKIIDFLKTNKFVVYSNDEEIILAWDMKERIELRMKNENLTKIDKILTVGEVDTVEIKKQFPQVSNNIQKIGNLRLDLLKNKNSIYLEKEAKIIKENYGDFILLASQFSKVNVFRKTEDFIDFATSIIIRDKIPIKSKTAINLYDQITMQREVLIEVLDFINNFEINFPNKNLVISPHPVENKIFWKKYLSAKSFKNIYLNKFENFNTNSFIKACDFVISTNSTSLLEAFILEKKIINFLGKKSRDVEIGVLKQISNVVRSSEELNKLILNQNNITKFESSSELKNSIENLENIESIDLLLQTINKQKNINSYDSIFISPKISFNTYLLNKFREFKSDIKKVFNLRKNGLTFNDLLHKDKIGDNLTYSSYQNRVKNLNNIEKVENLKFEQILPEVFLLDKN
tara:strand:- start:1865 stop:3259 length:1395 start_codon:yes stop_codon:yes gene_type:complete